MICDAALIDRTVGRRGADHPQRRAPRQASAAASGAVGGDSQAVGIAAALSRADFLHGTDSAIYPGQAPAPGPRPHAALHVAAGRRRSRGRTPCAPAATALGRLHSFGFRFTAAAASTVRHTKVDYYIAFAYHCTSTSTSTKAVLNRRKLHSIVSTVAARTHSNDPHKPG